MEPFNYQGKDYILSDVKEAMGQFKAGFISEEEFKLIEDNTCQTCGACGMMELPTPWAQLWRQWAYPCQAGTIGALASSRLRLARRSGERIVDMVREDLRFSKILTKENYTI